MIRVIQGIPTSWDSSIANKKFPASTDAAAWSPCSCLIATAHLESPGIIILDAVTLDQLHTMHPPQKEMTWMHMTFSPGSHLLAAYSKVQRCIVSWDVQTGGLLSNISIQGQYLCSSVSFSECETMIGGLFDNNTIIIYNLLSGLKISSHPTPQPAVDIIWTCGEDIQFATMGLGSITMWQVSFTSNHSPVKVGSLSIPDSFPSEKPVLLPTHSRLAFTLGRRVLVWDAQNQKVLLDSADVKNPRAMSFSPCGHFFVCGTYGREIYIWKESPAGYLSYQKLVSTANATVPLISPNGESVISHGNGARILQLWPTPNSSTYLPSISIQTPHHHEWFCIEFSPTESLVAFSERLSSTVTVLDTESGNPLFFIDTDTEVCGLMITADEIIVVGNGKIITWNIPARDCISNTQRDIYNSVQTTTFYHPAPISMLWASVSPNLNYIAFGDQRSGISEDLCIYNTNTGEKLAAAKSKHTYPGFTSSGHAAWYVGNFGNLDQWQIIVEGPDSIKLKQLWEDVEPLHGFPWHSPNGYQVTGDGWILNSSRKQLLWLPPHLQPDIKIQRKWSGKYLAVWNWGLPGPCLLKLDV